MAADIIPDRWGINLGAIRSSFGRYFWRSVWAVLWAAHIPAFVAALLSIAGDVTAVGRVALLAGSLALFLAKALDVPMLRFRWNWRSLCGAAAMVVLLHANVIERSLPSDLDTPIAWQLVVIAAPAVAVGAAIRIWLRNRRPARRSVAATVRALCRNGWLLAEQSLLPPRFLPLARSCLVDRAPPSIA